MKDERAESKDERKLFLSVSLNFNYKKKVANRKLATFSCMCVSLPNGHTLLLGQEHSTIGNTEGLVEGLDVTQCDVHAVLTE